MSSGFVCGGTADQPTERDDEWLQAQKDIENTRRRKEEEIRQSGGKTLYEVLQQNKGKYILPNPGCSFDFSLNQLLTYQVFCASPSCKARSLRRIHTLEKPVSKSR